MCEVIIDNIIEVCVVAANFFSPFFYSLYSYLENSIFVTIVILPYVVPHVELVIMVSGLLPNYPFIWLV